ncbi:9639_t:CDS:2, partial [Acaulospora colombiana]
GFSGSCYAQNTKRNGPIQAGWLGDTGIRAKRELGWNMAEVVLQYLEEYAKVFDLLPHIQFSTRVVRVERSTTEGRATWVVTTEKSDTSSASGVKRETLSNVHAIFSANGRHGRPVFPSSIPGLDSWVSKGKASHSMFYREPHSYRNKTIVVVGNGPSALDLAPEIADVAKMVYRSVRNKASGSIDARDRPANESSVTAVTEKLKICTAIRSLDDPEAGIISLVDGTKLSGVDHVLFATGYEFWSPFFAEDVLRESRNEKIEPKEGLFNTGQSVIPTSKHLIPLSPSIPIGSWFILGLPRPVVPFPLVEAQCLLASAILTGKVHLDFDTEMEEFEELWEKLKEKFDGDPSMMSSEWHKLPEEKQFDYRCDLVNISGGDVDAMVPRWQRSIYAAKRELKAAWNAIDKQGKAEEKVSGVGEGGEQEWVGLMFDILREYGKSSSRGQADLRFFRAPGINTAALERGCFILGAMSWSRS